MKATALLIAAVSAKAGMSADDFSQVGEAFEQPQMADPNKPGYHLVGSLSLAQHKMDIFDSVLEKEFGSVGVDMDSFNTDEDSPSASASMVQKAKAPVVSVS